MSARITAAERAALPVARAALESRDSAYGVSDTIVFALGAAGLLADAEVAQAVAGLRADELAPGSYPRMRAALGALRAAQRQHGDGLVPQVWALEAAGLLQSPDAAAEVVALRKRLAELEAERHSTNEALDDAVQSIRAQQVGGAS